MKALKAIIVFLCTWIFIYTFICGVLALLFWENFYVISNSTPMIIAGIIPISICSGIVVDCLIEEKKI